MKRVSEIDVVVAQIRAGFATDAAALKELSYALNCSDRFREAISVAEQGLAIDPNNAWLHHNAAYGFSMLGEFPAFKAHSTEAARLMPDDAVMQSNLADAHLLFGEFEQGWAKYKWREKMPVNSDLARPEFPEWQGEPLSGKTFLLIGEQGLGDQIQFLRMAAWLHRQGATVDVWVDVPLGELARGASGVNAAWTTRPAGSYDYWSRMLRVPEYAKVDMATLPVAMPYLTVASEKRRQWQTYLDRTSRAGYEEKTARSRRVGPVWAGNPDYANDRYRSIKLDSLQSVLAQTGITWYSVQKGDRERDSEILVQQFDMHTLGPVIHDFTDTLAILHSLDLLITIDSLVSHLAGAAGLPVWVLVPAYANWRWLTDGTDSPWYPSMRLFRQRELGEWGAVIEDVRKALGELCPADERRLV
jgi:tetratricopeptide (TPR) repeat protein